MCTLACHYNSNKSVTINENGNFRIKILELLCDKMWLLWWFTMNLFLNKTSNWKVDDLQNYFPYSIAVSDIAKVLHYIFDCRSLHFDLMH